MNWGAFIQVKTHAKQSGSEIIMDQFEVIYPSEAVTNVELSAGKTFYSTGSKGNFTFVILYNGATEIKDAGDDDEEVPADATPAKNSTTDLDRVAKKRSGVTARAGGVETDKKFSKKALGRDYQR